MSIDRYRDRVVGCWLGKAIGGTLGMPFEGKDGPFDLSYYQPVPQGMVANDDLDLQVLWACKLAEMATPVVDRQWLGQAWLNHVHFPWDEYGVAIRNLRLGLHPPMTGSYDNWFACGMGAAIRTEIWACLAAGDPGLAAQFAYEDACVDHDGDDIWAAVFLAGLEAAAFVNRDPHSLLETALAPLPVASLVRRCVVDTELWWRRLKDWREVRSLILEQYGHENFTDVVMNMGFTVLGWLAGEGDFGRSICVATNCGKDTDCTAATVGSLLGILDPDSIPENWIAPIGRSLVVDRRITGIQPPATLDGFTDMVLDLAARLDRCVPDPAMSEISSPALHIPAILGFVSAEVLENTATVPTMPANAQSIRLSGSVAELPKEAFKDDVGLLRYQIRLPEPQRTRIVVNTRERNRVWIDGRFAFGRDGGLMCPAMHRAPENQWIDLDLDAGRHEILIAMARPIGPLAHWAVALGDASTCQWLPILFNRAVDR